MKQVAFVNRELLMNRGGGEINDLSVARELVNHDVDVEFLARTPVLEQPNFDVSDFDLTTVSSPYLYGISHSLPGIVGSIVRHIDGIAFARQVGRTLEQQTFDVVQLTGRPSLIRVAGHTDAKVVYSVRGEISDFYIDRLTEADALIAWGNSADGIRDRGVSLPPMVELTPGVAVEAFENRDGSTVQQRFAEDDEPLFLFVGRFVRLKNLQYLISEFERACRALPVNPRLLLVGDGPLRDQLHDQAAKTTVADRIEFTGQVSHSDIPEFYAAADLFVMSSISENYPIVLLEAMASGLPVVAPSVGGIPKIVQNGRHGILFDTYDPGSLADGIQEILALDSDAVGNRNKSRIQGQYSWRSRAESIKELYDCINA